MTAFRMLALATLGALALGGCTKSSTSDSSNTGTTHSCQDYCGLYLVNCTGPNDAYTDNNDCMTQCSAWAQGNPGDQTGNTLECRYYHATAAGSDPTTEATHCPHAGPTGGGTGGPCSGS